MFCLKVCCLLSLLYLFVSFCFIIFIFSNSTGRRTSDWRYGSCRTLSQQSTGNDKNYARKDLNKLSSNVPTQSIVDIVLYKMKDLFSFNDHVKPGVHLASCVAYKLIRCVVYQRETESGDNTLNIMTSHHTRFRIQKTSQPSNVSSEMSACRFLADHTLCLTSTTNKRVSTPSWLQTTNAEAELRN